MSPRIFLFLAVTCVLASACGNKPTEPTKAVAAVEVTPLMTDAEPIRAWFEANAGKPRFVSILSPT